MIDIVIHGKNDGWIAFGLIEEKRQMASEYRLHFFEFKSFFLLLC